MSDQDVKDIVLLLKPNGGGFTDFLKLGSEPIRFGDYDITGVEKKGAQGFGCLKSSTLTTSFPAVHRKSQRAYVIKFLNPKAMQTGVLRDHFAKIWQTYMRSGPPGFVRAIESDEKRVGRDALLYLVMEDTGRRTLQTIISDTRTGMIEPRAAVAMVRDVAKALDGWHSRGLIHNGVSPRNVILRDNYEPLLLEPRPSWYDILKVWPRSSESDFGSHYSYKYGSPEVGNEPASVATDVYSIGAFLYSALTKSEIDSGIVGFGEHDTEYVEEKIAYIAARLKTPPPPNRPIREIPEELSQFMSKSMALDPRARYKTMTDVVRDLSVIYSLLSGDPRPTKPAKVPATFHMEAIKLLVSCFENLGAKKDADLCRRLLPQTGEGGLGHMEKTSV